MNSYVHISGCNCSQYLVTLSCIKSRLMRYW